MFPWIDGFHWSAGHVVFLSLFYAVVLTLFSTVAWAVWRTVCDFRTRRATELCWRENFKALPKAERHCRHELAGRVASRICENAFDCCHCLNFTELAALPPRVQPQNAVATCSDQLLYHRGHTWVRPEVDGTVTVGLDDFARHLIGQPDSLELPMQDSKIEKDGIAWRMIKNGHEIRVRAPLDGTVEGIGGDQEGWYLRLRPSGPADLRHLLDGAEVPGWLRGELDRLQLQLSAPGAAPCLADGGMLMPDLMDAMPSADWDTVLASTFLES